MRRGARSILLTVVFVCAACGLVYELALVTLGSYLIGNTATQASIVLSVMVFAMGIGSLAVKPLQRFAMVTFALIELALALFGGLSVLILYAAFAYLELYTPALIVVALLLGLLIGGEIPLLMVLLQRIRRQDAGSAVADMFSVDYIGALVGGLAFPFILLPLFGQIQGALIVGLVNAVAGMTLTLIVFRRSLTARATVVITLVAVLVAAVLVAGLVYAGRFEVDARQALYRDPVVAAERTPYQDIVITQRSVDGMGVDTRLFLNGDLQFSSVDEYRYHEALVHPVMAGAHRSVLVLGGGDGLAMREILRYPDMASATLVELDPAMIDLARHDRRLTDLNRHSLDDPRATVVVADAFSWLRSSTQQFDVIVVDMPDPDETATAKLYSEEFYGLVRAHLAPGGRSVVQAGSPYFAPRSYWCINSTVRAAGLATVPYHVDVPSFGDWGFVLGSAGTEQPPGLTVAAPPGLRFLTTDELRAASVFPLDRAPRTMPTSTLINPRILSYSQSEWAAY